MQVRKKPAYQEAIEYTGDNASEVQEFTGFNFVTHENGQAEVYDFRHDSWINVSKGDFIMRVSREKITLARQIYSLRVMRSSSS